MEYIPVKENKDSTKIFVDGKDFPAIVRVHESLLRIEKLNFKNKNENMKKKFQKNNVDFQ